MQFTREKRPAYLVVLGGVLLVIGSFLPWIRATLGPLGSITQSGTRGGDGWITFGLGIALIFLGAAMYFVPHIALRITVAVLAVGALALTTYEVVDIQRQIDEFEEEATVNAYSASHGIGLYVLGVGGIVALVGAFDRFSKRPVAPEPSQQVPQAIPPGWYPFPPGSTDQQRYWDGTAWTEHVHRRTDAPPPA